MSEVKKAKKGRPKVIFWELVVYDGNYTETFKRSDFVSKKQAKHYFHNRISSYKYWVVRKIDRRINNEKRYI